MSAKQEANANSHTSFLVRHEFLVRRLHSLAGLIPVGAYMVVHLVTNSTVLDSPATFQKNVYSIHALGKLLPFVEWTFIFIPLLFHAILGIVIVRGGLPNSSQYQYASNVRYTLQRASGMVAFFFIMWHVFHMHGWFHFDAWLDNVAHRLMGAQFRAYNAASSAGEALQASLLVQILYAVGILACVFHLANGLWTMGITWGVWVTPTAQRRADYVCGAFGLGLAVLGLSALWGMTQVDVQEAVQVEDRIYQTRVDAGELSPNEHKRWSEAERQELDRESESPASAPQPGREQEVTQAVHGSRN